jgi:pyrroline-5-carboxylate reductase
MNILVIGGGNMGKTLAQSILQSNIVSAEELFIFEKDEDKVVELNNEQLGTAFSTVDQHFEKADLLILAVKPQDAALLFPTIAPFIQSNKIILSIMAGIKINDIKKATGATKIVRAMPNLPSQVGKGTTGYFFSKEMNEEDKSIIQRILNSIGISIEVKEEDKIDAITAISGSGPAYVYYFMDAMIQAAIQLGFNKEDAFKLVSQTFEGSIQLLKENELSCQEWIQRVSSKGGTTEAALSVFDQSNVKNLIGKGVLRAENRSKELSKS